MSNPIIALLAWMEKLDKEIQTEIAFAISTEHPSFNIVNLLTESPEKFVSNFYEKISEFSNGTPNDVGFILAFRAIFDFSLANVRGNSEAYKQTSEMFESMTNDENLLSVLAKVTNNTPENREKWISVCESWQTLKKIDLSDAMISIWQANHFISHNNINL